MNALVVFLVALSVYLTIELLQRKLGLKEIQEKSKNLLEKLRENPQDEATLKELLEVQRKFYVYFMAVSFVVLSAIAVLKFIFGNNPVLEFSFNIPFLNRNWLGPLGSYILFYFIISTTANLLKKIYKNFLRKSSHGQKNSHS